MKHERFSLITSRLKHRENVIFVSFRLFSISPLKLKMDVVISVLVCLFTAVITVNSVPPALCFEQFKWEDCGMTPKAVIYYYKSGSRCEVGMWRGCLPNANMFSDEYECVQTCIFSQRAKPEDFHNLQVNQVDFEGTPGSEEILDTTTAQSEGNSTETQSDTDVTSAGNSTDINGDVTATRDPEDPAAAENAATEPAAENAATELAAEKVDGETEATAAAA